MLRSLVRRAFYPRHLAQLVRNARQPKDDRKCVHDAELEFCAEILSDGFLNYGYYEDPAIPPEQISLHHIQQAQRAYAQLLIDLIADKTTPVLDAGCGMGGLLDLLIAQGFNPVALTPNHSQIKYIQARHPNAVMLEGRFDEATLRSHRHQFGTLITSESFQYMKVVPALRTVDHVLAPGGRWVLCDYFRIAETRRRSGHQWSEFNRALDDHGWTVQHERDITPNVLPTLRYLHMLGDKVGGAAADFAIGKLKRKRPALHYLFGEVITDWRRYLADQVCIVDPELFSREKKYMLMVMERR